MTFEIPYPCLKCDYQEQCAWLQVKLDTEEITTHEDQYVADNCKKRIDKVKEHFKLQLNQNGGKHNGKHRRRSKGIHTANNKKHR